MGRYRYRGPAGREAMLSEPVAVTLQVTRALERLGVPYVIGSSVASTAHGRIRTTMLVFLASWR